MPVLRWNSNSPVSDSSGPITVPTAAAPVQGIQITVGDCPPRKGLKRFNVTVTVEYGASPPPVNMRVTVAGAPVSGGVSFTRVGTSSSWRGSVSVNRDVGEGQSIGLQADSLTSSPLTMSDCTCSVVATDWGDLD